MPFGMIAIFLLLAHIEMMPDFLIILKDNIKSRNAGYVNRPERYVSFIGISSCVPDVEVENYKSFLNLELHERRDDTSRKILTACSYVLNIPYQRMAICESRFGKEYLSVLREEMGYCTSLSMGAGEQRVFRILSEAYRCPKYSLLLIDELDLLLHETHYSETP